MPPGIDTLPLLRDTEPSTVLRMAGGRAKGIRGWRLGNATMLTAQCRGGVVFWSLRIATVFGDVWALAHQDGIKRFFKNFQDHKVWTEWSPEDIEVREEAHLWMRDTIADDKAIRLIERLNRKVNSIDDL